MIQEDPKDVELLQMCLDTGIGSASGQVKEGLNCMAHRSIHPAT